MKNDQKNSGSQKIGGNLPVLGFVIKPERGALGAYLEILLLAGLAALCVGFGFYNFLLTDPETALALKIAAAILFFIGFGAEGMTITIAVALIAAESVLEYYIKAGPISAIGLLFCALFAGRMVSLFFEAVFDGAPSIIERRPPQKIFYPALFIIIASVVGLVFVIWRSTDFYGILTNNIAALYIAEGLLNYDFFPLAAASAFPLMLSGFAFYLSLRYNWSRGWKYFVAPLVALVFLAAVIHLINYGTSCVTDHQSETFNRCWSAAFAWVSATPVLLLTAVILVCSHLIERGKKKLMLIPQVLGGIAVYLHYRGVDYTFGLLAAGLSLICLHAYYGRARKKRRFAIVGFIGIGVLAFARLVIAADDFSMAAGINSIVAELSMIIAFPFTGVGSGGAIIELFNETVRRTDQPGTVGAFGAYTRMLTQVGFMGVIAGAISLFAVLGAARKIADDPRGPRWLLYGLIAAAVSPLVVAFRSDPLTGAGPAILFGLIAGGIGSQAIEGGRRDIAGTRPWPALLLVLAVLSYTAMMADLSFGALSRPRRGVEAGWLLTHGFDESKIDETGRPYRPASDYALLPLEKMTTTGVFYVSSTLSELDKKPQVLEIYLGDQLLETTYLYDGRWYQVNLAVPEIAAARRAVIIRASRPGPPGNEFGAFRLRTESADAEATTGENDPGEGVAPAPSEQTAPVE